MHLVLRLGSLDQPKICSDLPSVFHGPWIEELKTLGVHLSDVGDNMPIEILLGADVLCRIYTGRRHVLSCGLVATETLFGWTLMGRVPEDTPRRSLVKTTFSHGKGRQHCRSMGVRCFRNH